MLILVLLFYMYMCVLSVDGSVSLVSGEKIEQSGN